MILTCMLAIGFSASSMKNHPRRNINHNCIQVISMANDVFYFKSDGDFAGANIDVYDYKTGEKVLSQVVEHRKTIVDMYFQPAGDYIILITKGELKQKYVYHKK